MIIHPNDKEYLQEHRYVSSIDRRYVKLTIDISPGGVSTHTTKNVDQG